LSSSSSSSTTITQVVGNRYENVAALAWDLHCLVNNALSYNSGTSPIYRLAKKLRTRYV